LLEELINILKLLKMRPASGYGETIIEWVDGEVVFLTKTEYIKPENIN
jgi:hypothetical protein